MDRTFRTESISIELIVNLNVDKYIDWLFNHKGITKAELKEDALALMQSHYREKNISNYRWAINEVFYKGKYWKEPTESAKLDFIFWRKDRFDTQMFWFESEKKGSPLPDKMIAEREGERICEHINSNPLYLHLLFKLLNGQVTDNYKKMAELIGNIDYLQFLYKVKNGINDATPETGKSEKPATKPDKKSKETSCRQYAIYFYFLWQSGEIEGWKDGGREQWLKVKAIEKKIDFQNFKTYFGKLFTPKNIIKSTTPNIADLKTVCILLKEFPKALKEATTALKSANDAQR